MKVTHFAYPPASPSPYRRDHPSISAPVLSTVALPRDEGVDVIPEIVGTDYQPVRMIGYGAYGQVWSARHRSSGSMVAIKRIPNVFSDSREAARTLREVQLLNYFRSSDYVVNMLDVIVHSTNSNEIQSLLLVFELMDCTLHDLIAKGEINREKRRLIILQLLLALRDLHSANVVHRDIRPKNILIRGGDQLKVCDFGMSRPIGRRMSLLANTTSTWYCPPEGLLNHPVYTTAADVWSVGCIMAEMLGSKIFLKGTSTTGQLKLIVDAVGRPSDNELQLLTTPMQFELLRCYPESPVQSLASRFPTADPLEIELLSQLLQFNPSHRITAERALMHPWFEGLAIPPSRTFESLSVSSSCSSPIRRQDLESKMTAEVSRFITTLNVRGE